MIYRLRNILNWVAFVALVVLVSFLLFVVWSVTKDASRAISVLGDIITFSWRTPGLPEYFMSLTSYLYPLWVFIQYIIWKHPVFIPWHFKDDEE